MRIVHVDTGREMRGGQRQVLLLLEGLAGEGHDCVLLARKGSPLADAGRNAGIPVYAATAAQLWLRSGRADLVHAHDGRAHTLAALLSRRPFLVSRRVAFSVGRSVLSAWKYRRASRYLAISEYVRGKLLEAGVPPEPIDVVYDAVKVQVREPDWSPEYPAVAIDSTDPQKGRDLIEQARKLSGIEVLFSNDLQRDLQRASMFVYISRSEGLGSAALLALSMGVPVIASLTGGLAEVFEDGVSGLHVTNDVPSIVRAMRRILSDQALALRLITEGRRRVAERFSERQMTDGTLAAYRRVLAG